MSPGLPRGPFRKYGQHLLDTLVEKTGEEHERMGGLEALLFRARLDQAGSLSNSYGGSRGPQPPAPAHPSVGLPASPRPAVWGSAGLLQGGPPLPPSSPFPTRPTLGLLPEPLLHHPQGKDHLPRFIRECLFLPFLHRVLEGPAVQSPPAARINN